MGKVQGAFRFISSFSLTVYRKVCLPFVYWWPWQRYLWEAVIFAPSERLTLVTETNKQCRVYFRSYASLQRILPQTKQVENTSVWRPRVQWEEH